ncbi:ArnT family glycosyltransferase [Dictyobacter arantiisoli]|uniref:Glycosyltransferase RgtA/B/C/D-like domain-containing protein n=1 Tax=Dictyobacter arantiisoli TaxID=2014874 RepID=A0A5A5T9P9_9CHLR|nr:glycosyltransferase family 39 protein [Dictyobacter arantiisoli]GCF08142.1 hypothetical protein KDI_17060 [Dictyobacter arantiisoli]
MIFSHKIRAAFPDGALIVFGLAIIVRILFNVTVARQYTPLHDSQQYRDIGLHLLTEHCFCLHLAISTVGRAPLWPFVIATITGLFGPSDFLARIFLCLVDAGTCVLIYLLVARLLNRRLALVAGIVAAFYPGLYVYTGWLYSETLYTFLLTAFGYLLCCLYQERLQRFALASGIAVALLALTRPNGLLVLALFIVWLVVLGWQKRFAWRIVGRMAMLVLLVVGILLTPWTVRNALVSQRFLPVATGDGTVLLGSYNDQILSKPWDQETWITPLRAAPVAARSFPLYTCTASCEISREDAFKQDALAWISKHLASLPGLLMAHFANTWLPAVHEADLPTDRFSSQTSSQIVLLMMNIFPIPVDILAVIGLWVTLKRWREFIVFYCLLLLTVGQDLIFYGAPRFRAPIEPVLIIWAIFGFSFLWQYLACRRSTWTNTIK